MGIDINAELMARTLLRRIAEPLVHEAAQALTEQLRAESYRQFNDDTGELRKTIRTEGNAAAIGDARHDYWQYVARKRRGDGRVWVRRVLDQQGAAAVAQAGQTIRRRIRR